MIQAIKNKTEELTSCQEGCIYQQAQQEQAQQQEQDAQGQTSQDPEDDDTIDADYEVKK